MKQNPTRKRKLEDLALKTQGPYTDHEDFIHRLLGWDWQDTALSLHAKPWLKLCRQHADTYLKTHGLTPDPRATPKPPHKNDPTQEDTNNDTDDDSYLQKEGLNETWQHNRSCCNIISDNQLLVDILTGHAVNTNDNLEPIFIRITNHIASIHHLGYRTALPGGEYVNWRYREFNKSADKQCNIALDNGHSHLSLHPRCYTYLARRANIFLQSDGGCRHLNASATGWSIKAIHPDNSKLVILARGANLITTNHNSLTIEAIAMDEALAWFHDSHFQATPPYAECWCQFKNHW